MLLLTPPASHSEADMTELPADSLGSAWFSQGWGAVRLNVRHGPQVGTWLLTRDTSWPLHDNPRHRHRHYPHLTGERTEAEPVSASPKSHSKFVEGQEFRPRLG